MKIIPIRGIADKFYPLYLSTTNNFRDLKPLLGNRFKRFIFIDEVVYRKFRFKIKSVFNSRNDFICVLNSSEKNKSWDNLGRILRIINARKPNRNDLVVAIGGGMILNTIGLAGSLIMRGLPVAFVPTTVTSQIDACIGSKQAVNFSGVKNFIGIFSDPEFCYVNYNFARTLEPKDFKSQWIEALKLALCKNKKLFLELVNELDSFNANFIDIYEKRLPTMIREKATVLRRDLREEKEGACLLYGHTVGHALEILSNGKIPHGSAVGLGMLSALYVSSLVIPKFNAQLIDIQRNILKKLNLITKIPRYISINKIVEKLEYNKKNTGGSINFVLLEDKVGKNIIESAIKRCYL